MQIYACPSYRKRSYIYDNFIPFWKSYTRCTVVNVAENKTRNPEFSNRHQFGRNLDKINQRQQLCPLTIHCTKYFYQWYPSTESLSLTSLRSLVPFLSRKDV